MRGRLGGAPAVLTAWGDIVDRLLLYCKSSERGDWVEERVLSFEGIDEVSSVHLTSHVLQARCGQDQHFPGGLNRLTCLQREKKHELRRWCSYLSHHRHVGST
jgi:hypothetical protein